MSVTAFAPRLVVLKVVSAAPVSPTVSLFNVNTIFVVDDDT